MQTSTFFEKISNRTDNSEIKPIDNSQESKRATELPFLYELFINNDVSTSDSAQKYQINKTFTNIILNCSKEEPEDEVSPFVKAAKEYLEKFGAEGVNLLETYIVNLTALPEHRDFITSLIEMLGDIDNQASYKQRYTFLEDNLKSKITEVRYGSVLGLACMKDKDAIPALEEALTNENIEIVHNSIQDTLALLRR